MENKNSQSLYLKEKMEVLESMQVEYSCEFNRIANFFKGEEFFKIKKPNEYESKANKTVYSIGDETFWQPKRMIVHSTTKITNEEQNKLLRQVDSYCILLKDAKGIPVSWRGFSMLEIEACVDYDIQTGKETMTASFFDGKQVTVIDVKKPERTETLNEIFKHVDDFCDAKQRYLDKCEEEKQRKIQEQAEKEQNKIEKERRQQAKKEALQEEKEWIENYKKNLESYIGK